MKKAIGIIIAMFCMCLSYAMAQATQVTDQPAKEPGVIKPVETYATNSPNGQPAKKVAKKSAIEICYCYDQVKPPCWKSPETPPCPK